MDNELVFFSKNDCIHHIFERVAACCPDAVAVKCEHETLTYHELNCRANRVAHYLQRLNVGPEKLVGVCLDRSPDMIISILGVLKAGGAYLPLDLAYPSERLAFMLQDAEAAVIVAQESVLQKLPETKAHIVCVDRDRGEIDREFAGNPASAAQPDSLAYVIYTSGSTGTPKGVMVTHYNVVRLFQSTQQWFQFKKNDIWTFFHSHAFDFSVWEIWGALLYGGRLIVIPYLISRAPELFYELLCEEQVTVLNQTPSAFRQLIRAEEALGEPKDLHLRLIIFGGEALELQSLLPWFDRHGDRKPQLVNMYGITETTVHVTYRPLTLDDVRSRRGSVIGIPIPDLQIHILDETREPSPIGALGEMYVGGAGVARGYLYREALTAERFIRNPFSSAPNDRLYKTGDMAKRLPDGDIEYVGRIDQQVKIRGFRIELGEIESALALHPHVREAAAVVYEDDAGHKSLAAYVVVKQGSPFFAQDMRSFLRSKLPDYMVPTAFVRLDRLPLTPNGKLDRGALPKPQVTRETIATAYAPPATTMEQTIAALFREVLKSGEVGIYDNFFDLGGDSLLAAQLILKIRDACALSIKIAKLFEHPTVHALAGYLSASASGERLYPDVFNRAAKQKDALLKRRQLKKS